MDYWHSASRFSYISIFFFWKAVSDMHDVFQDQMAMVDVMVAQIQRTRVKFQRHRNGDNDANIKGRMSRSRLRFVKGPGSCLP